MLNIMEADEVCDPGNPMQTARRLVAVKFDLAGQRTFHRHRGTFWCWDGACYREVSTDACNDTIWEFLEHAKRLNENGGLVPFKPTRDKVGNVREAFASSASSATLRIHPSGYTIDAGSRLPMNFSPAPTDCCGCRIAQAATNAELLRRHRQHGRLRSQRTGAGAMAGVPGPSTGAAGQHSTATGMVRLQPNAGHIAT